MQHRSESDKTRIRQKPLSFWIKLLCRPGLASRIAASRAFAALGAEAGPAIPSLIALLAAPDLRTRRRSYLVLLRLGLEANVLARASMALYNEPDPRDEASRAWFKSMGFQDDPPNRSVRMRLLESARQADLDSAGCLAFFVALLDDPDDPVCNLASRVLRGPWLPAPPDWLRNVASGDPVARIQAAHAAGSIGTEGLPLLRLLIQDPEPSVRRVAAVALGRLDAEALAELAIALEDEDPKVRRQAVWALGRPLGPEAIGLLIQAIGHPRAEVRKDAIDAVKSLGILAKDALPALEQAREDPDVGVSSVAGYARSYVSDRLHGKTLRHWAGRLLDPRPRIRRNVAKILVYAPRTDLMMDALTELVRDPDPEVRNAACYAFEEGDLDVTHPAFLSLLHDPDPRHRWNALGILHYGMLGQCEAAVGRIIAMLDDPDEGVRSQVVHRLVRRGDEYRIHAADVLPVPESCGGVADPGDRYARARAAAALGDWDEEGLLPLQDTLRDPDTLVRRAAVVAIWRIGAAALGVAQIALGDDDAHVRMYAASFISQCDPEALPRLVHLLDDPSAAVRVAAIDGLARFGQSAEIAIPWLHDAVDRSTDSQVRRAAVAALGEVAPTSPDAVSTLVNVASDPDPEIRVAAIESLGAATPEFPQVIPTLIRAMGDLEPLVRRASALSLGRIGPRAHASVSVMIDACSDPVWHVSTTARANLLRLLSETSEDAEVEAVVATLTEALNSGNWLDRFWGLEALSSLIGTPPSTILSPDTSHRHPSCADLSLPCFFPPAAKGLAKAFHHHRPDVCRSAIHAFVGCPEAAKIVLPELIVVFRTHTDSQVHSSCSTIFRELGPDAADVVPDLIAALGESDHWTRLHTAITLACVAPSNLTALSILIEGLDRPESRDRAWAAYGLGQMGSSAQLAIPLLKKTLLDSNEPTRNAAANALEQIQSASSDSDCPVADR
ncbi:HEAT repeat domain-containing protein [Singulisphaera sp. Ch08]|uniref:HEAT repeat domain-containing protein n=1 Tax=Singulisphaera sp. Ch08 TaxID=3120278 RepID=A0AAU7C9K5_9BACT